MTRKADTLRPFLRCAAVVLCSLALPLVVFALWDRALLAAPHTRTDGERFSAAGRANATACTLYAAEHVTKVPLGSNSLWDGGWTAGTMDGSALARARRTLRALHEAGLLCDDSYAAALSVCRLDYGSWELYTAPCGLTQLVRRPEEIYTDTDTEHVYIQLILSSDDAPLYFNYQNDLGRALRWPMTLWRNIAPCLGWTSLPTGNTRNGAQPYGILAQQATVRPRRSTPWRTPAGTALRSPPPA